MAAGLPADAQQLQHQRGGMIHQPDQRRSDAGEDRHGTRHGQEAADRVAQGDRFWGLLADHHQDKRQQQEHQHRCQRSGEGREERHLAEQPRQDGRKQQAQRFLGHHAEQNRCHRDADL